MRHLYGHSWAGALLLLSSIGCVAQTTVGAPAPPVAQEVGMPGFEKFIGEFEREDVTPGLLREAAANFLNGGFYTLPGPNDDVSEQSFRGGIEGLTRVRDASREALQRLSGEASEVAAAIFNFVGYLIDAQNEIARVTRQNAPGEEAAQRIEVDLVAGPFMPLNLHNYGEPEEDIMVGTVTAGDCMVVMKEVNGLVVKIEPMTVPIWVEPWSARRRIIGYRIIWVWRFIPAELVKHFSFCNKGLHVKKDVDVQIVEVPHLLKFWRLFRKDP